MTESICHSRGGKDSIKLEGKPEQLDSAPTPPYAVTQFFFGGWVTCQVRDLDYRGTVIPGRAECRRVKHSGGPSGTGHAIELVELTLKHDHFCGL
jgi:hypothetical protein